MTDVAEGAQRGAFHCTERVEKIGEGHDHRGVRLALDQNLRRAAF